MNTMAKTLAEAQAAYRDAHEAWRQAAAAKYGDDAIAAALAANPRYSHVDQSDYPDYSGGSKHIRALYDERDRMQRHLDHAKICGWR